MKKLSIIFLFLLLNCSDSDPVSDCIDPTRFEYDARLGVCKKCNGETGYNPGDLVQIRKTKNASCLHLSKVELLSLLGDTTEIPQRFEYDTLLGYDFKGSVLDSCTLYFNFIIKADLRGTDLRTLQYGYAEVTGRRDNFTKLPLMGIIRTQGDSISCMN